MYENLKKTLKDSVKSVLPIALIVLALNFSIAPMPSGTLAMFLTGAVLVTMGISLFSIGVENAMMPMGEILSSKLTRSRKLWLLILGGFALGIAVTAAEPDLQVLARQVPSVPNSVMVLTVALGVGIFLAIALLRILFKIRIAYVFLISYVLVFALAVFTAPEYLAVSFDSSGVTTGAVTVPFILAFGNGISSVSGGKNAEEDSFGLCGICSVGPIMAVLITGMFFDPSVTAFTSEAPTANTFYGIINLFGNGFIESARDVFMALLPITAMFMFFQLVLLKLPKREIIKIFIGLLYAFFGLTVFFTGVNTGFMPAGVYLGSYLGSLSYDWVLIPVMMLMGFFIVAAEPAVQILNKQVEEITSGAISKKMMMAGLSSGEGIALALAMLRIMTGISIWYILVPGFILALILALLVPDIFVSIAFDSGGVAAGTMAAAFLLPFATGVCKALGGNAITDAFGLVGLIAMMPLITVQAMGLIYKIKMRRAKKPEEAKAAEAGLMEKKAGE